MALENRQHWVKKSQAEVVWVGPASYNGGDNKKLSVSGP